MMKAYCLECKQEKRIIYNKRKVYKRIIKYTGLCIKCKSELCRVIAINV